ncbi:uncharacterized protein LOC133912149 [Phragmites australis]|uniref:uncharacterized protein LOC133912149 n=1 Tax=Phragmites australis TaxID=29695 RepID=UPI002D76C97C|nr:uncharacterized protein LOC133912149 [Phragmites australis]
MLHRISCHVPAVADVFSDADVKNARWSWLRRSLYALMLLSLSYFAYFALFSRNSVDGDLLRCPFCEPLPPPPAPAAAIATRSPTTLAHIVFLIGASNATWGKRRVYTSLWWRPGAMRGHVWLDEEPSGHWRPAWPPYRVLRPNVARFGKEHAAAARMVQAVVEAYETAEAARREEGASEVRWLVMGDDDTVFFPENLVAVLDKYDHREMYYVGSSSESVGQNVAHSYSMAFGGGGYAISYPAAAALSRIMDGCLDRYNDLYGSDHRVQACLAEIGVPLTREPGFHQLDLKGHVYGLLAAHPVAPLVSLHHVDRLNPISPNSLKRLHAVRSLVDASRRDPTRTLQQSICYWRSRNRFTLSVSVSWGYMVHLYPSAVPPHELQTPLRTFRAWSGSPEGPFTVNTRNATALPCHRQPIMFYLDRVTEEPSAPAPAAGQNWTLTEYVPEVVSSDSCNGPGFDAAAKVQTIQVLALKMDPAIWKRAPRRQCCKAQSAKEDALLVKIYECKPNEAAAMV